MNISLPEGLKAFIDKQVAERGFASSSEFVRDLIRRELDRQRLKALLGESLEAPSEPVDAAFFQDLRDIADR